MTYEEKKELISKIGIGALINGDIDAVVLHEQSKEYTGLTGTTFYYLEKTEE